MDYEVLNVRQYGIYQFKPDSILSKNPQFLLRIGLERYHERYDILMRLHTEVLFIRDKTEECFHSRISLQKRYCLKHSIKTRKQL